MPNPLTIFLPVRNAARFLPGWYQRNWIDSTFKNYSLLVVDNGSSDESCHIIESWDIPEKRIIHHGADRGLEESFRTAWRHMQNKYLMFLPCDDWLAPNYLEDAVSALEKNEQCGVAYGYGYMSFLDSNKIIRRFMPQRAIGPYRESVLSVLAFTNFIPDISVWRQTAVEDVGGWPADSPWMQKVVVKHDVFFTGKDHSFSGKHGDQESRRWAADHRYFLFYTNIGDKLFSDDSVNLPEKIVIKLLQMVDYSGMSLLDAFLQSANARLGYVRNVLVAHAGEVLLHVVRLIVEQFMPGDLASMQKGGKLGRLDDISKALQMLSGRPQFDEAVAVLARYGLKGVA